MTEATACRRCSECPNSNHHWIEGPPLDWPEEDENPPWYHCKHCEAFGDQCHTCGGDGQGKMKVGSGNQPFPEYYDCHGCDGEGVTVRDQKLISAYIITRPDLGCGTWMYCGPTVEGVLNVVRTEIESEIDGDEYSPILIDRRKFTQEQIDNMPDFPGW